MRIYVIATVTMAFVNIIIVVIIIVVVVVIQYQLSRVMCTHDKKEEQIRRWNFAVSGYLEQVSVVWCSSNSLISPGSFVAVSRNSLREILWSSFLSIR